MLKCRGLLTPQEVDIAHAHDGPVITRTGPLFPPWGTRVFRLAFFVAVLAVLAVPAASWAWARTPYVSGVCGVVGGLGPPPHAGGG